MLLYGVVLFLDINDFIYISIINIFLAKNLVSALLADVYYYHHVRHEKNKGIIMCCALVLHTWLMSHLPRDGPFMA